MKTRIALLMMILISLSLQASLPQTAGGTSRNDRLSDSSAGETATGIFAPDQAIEMNILVDVSGSMDAGLRELANQTAESILASLRPRDSFTLRTFAGSSDAFAATALPAESVRRPWTTAWLQRRHVSGGIELPGAVREILSAPASKERQRVIVIITDGRLWGVEETFSMIRKSAPTTTVIACNVGPRPSPRLLETTANYRRGFGMQIRQSAEIRDRISALWNDGGALLSENSNDIHFTIQNAQGGL
jgi:hypothetical protein